MNILPEPRCVPGHIWKSDHAEQKVQRKIFANERYKIILNARFFNGRICYNECILQDDLMGNFTS